MSANFQISLKSMILLGVKRKGFVLVVA